MRTSPISTANNEVYLNAAGQPVDPKDKSATSVVSRVEYERLHPEVVKPIPVAGAEPQVDSQDQNLAAEMQEQIDALTSENETLRTENESIRADLNRNANDFGALKAQHEGLKSGQEAALKTADGQIEEMRAMLSDTADKSNSLKAENEALKSRLAELESAAISTPAKDETPADPGPADAEKHEKHKAAK